MMGMPLRLGEASTPLTPVSDPGHSHSCKAAASGRGAERAAHVRGLVGSDTSSSHPHPGWERAQASLSKSALRVSASWASP